MRREEEEEEEEERRREGGAGALRGEAGGSKRIIHPLFGEQVGLNEAWRAALATNIHFSCNS